MTTQSEQLEALLNELHAINKELEDAAQPLRQRAELNEEARDHLGKELRARLARWECVAQKIQQVLEQLADVDSACEN